MASEKEKHRIRQELVALLPRLRRFASGLGGWEESPDDLVQSACERALARLDQFEPGTRLDSWMFRIIQTIWLDGRRRAQHRRTQDMEMTGDTPNAVSENANPSAETQVTLETVRKEIARLPDDQRIVLLLVCVEGLTYKETSDALGVPVGTVMSRLARARFALVRMMERSDGYTGDNVLTLSTNANYKHR
jgi:RNA polymerase sigma-70 factor (ECF subfamily)